jgi:hypothetical protein
VVVRYGGSDDADVAWDAVRVGFMHTPDARPSPAGRWRRRGLVNDHPVDRAVHLDHGPQGFEVVANGMPGSSSIGGSTTFVWQAMDPMLITWPVRRGD